MEQAFHSATGSGSDGGMTPQVQAAARAAPVRAIQELDVIGIMGSVLPADWKFSDDAKEMMEEWVSDFVSFITGEASIRCQYELRTTITVDDVLWAMSRHASATAAVAAPHVVRHHVMQVHAAMYAAQEAAVSPGFVVRPGVPQRQQLGQYDMHDGDHGTHYTGMYGSVGEHAGASGAGASSAPAPAMPLNFEHHP